jgi:hypothetical protein
LEHPGHDGRGGFRAIGGCFLAIDPEGPPPGGEDTFPCVGAWGAEGRDPSLGSAEHGVGTV